MKGIYCCVVIFGLISLDHLTSAKVLSKLPDYLKICHKKDPNLNACVHEAIAGLRPKLANGIDELLVPACEPLAIPQVTIKQNAGAICMESEYSNILVYGLTNFTLKGVKVDPDSAKFRIKLWFPTLKMTAKYNIHGKLLLLPLAGHGDCNGNFSDIDAIISIKTGTTMLNGRQHLKVNDLFVEFNIGKADIHLDDLFNGDSELGDMMNNFLNENWTSIAAEIRPALEDAVSNILQGMASRFFEVYTHDQLLPP